MNRPLTIAVADDERDTREYLQDLLTRQGHHVHAAATGRELLECCRRAAPDLIITDIKMPDMDGIEAAETFNRDKETPVILVSGHHSPELLQRAQAGHVMSYLVKPIHQADVEAAVALALARFAQYQEARQEAASLRQALEDRKVIERAKGIITRRLNVDEPHAFRRLRKLASDHNRKLIDVALTVVKADEVFQELEGL